MFTRLLLSLGMIQLVLTGQSQTADEIVRKHIEAIGGYEGIKAIKTMIVEGTMVNNNQVKTFKSYIVHDSAIRTENNFNGITGFGIVVKNAGWKFIAKNAKSAIKKKSKQEIKDAQYTLDLHGPLIDYTEKGNTLEYLGMEKIGTTDCHKLKITRADKSTLTYFLDSTFLISRVIYSWPGSNLNESVTDYIEYETVDGFRFVKKSVRQDDGMETTYKYHRINPEIDRTLFIPRKP